MLKGRDGKSLKHWLKKHKKIKVVARDRANAFTKVIKEVLPKSIQVADRFHLIDNIESYLGKILRKKLPKKIFIRHGKILKRAPKKIRVKNNSLLSSKDSKVINDLNYDNTPPVDVNGSIIRYNKHLLRVNSLAYKRQKYSRKKRKELILEIRKDSLSRGFSIENTAMKYGLKTLVIQKYLNMTPEKIKELDTINVRKRKSVIDDYINIIFKMMLAGYSDRTIFLYVISKGYKRNQSTLWTYLYIISKNNFDGRETESQRHLASNSRYPKDVTIVKREHLISELLKKGNGNYEYKDTIEASFPVVKTSSEIYRAFYSAIMGTDVKAIYNFLNKYDESEVTKFCTKIKEDIAAVGCAISSSINSGFVEGNNNKIKLMERIVYGKTNFDNFFKKCQLVFLETSGKLDLDKLFG